jgi:hypothetical protein
MHFDKKTLVMNIAVQHDTIFCQLPGQPAFQLYPESETMFFLKPVDAQISFTKDAHSKIVSLTLHQGGQRASG